MLGLELWLGWRVALAGRLRSVLFVVLAGTPVLVMALGVGLVNAVTQTAQQVQESTGTYGVTSLALEDRPGAAPAVIAALPASATVLSSRIQLTYPGVAIVGEGHGVTGSYLEQDWSRLPSPATIRVVQGRLPSAAGELAVTVNTTERLHLQIGSRINVAFDRAARVVVGVVSMRLDVSAYGVLAPVGTWDQIPTPRYEFLGADRKLIVAGADPDELVASGAPVTSVEQASDFTEPLPYWMRQTLLVVAPGLVVVLAAAVGAMLARQRRLATDMAVLGSLGLQPHRIRRTVLAGSIVLLVPGTIVMAALGFVASLPLAPWFAGTLNREVTRRGVPWLVLAVLAAASLAAVAAAGVIVARRAAAASNTGAGARPAEESLPSRSRHPAIRRSIGSAGAAAFVALVVIKPGQDSIVGGLLLLAAAAAAVAGFFGDLLTGLERIAVRTPPAIRFSAVVAARDYWRSAALACISMLLVAFPVAILANVATLHTAAVDRYQPSIPTDQIRVRTLGTPLPDAAITALAAAAGAAVIPLRKIDGTAGDPAENTSPGPPVIIVVDTVDQIRALTGYTPTAADRSALERGAVLLWRPDRHESSRLTVYHQSASGEATPGPTLPTAAATGAVPGAAEYLGSAVILTHTAAATHLTAQLADYRIPYGAAKLPATIQAGLAYGLPESAFTIDPGPDPGPNIRANLVLAMALGIGVLTTLALSASATWERRRLMSQFTTLGMSRRSALATRAMTAALPTTIGVLAGIALGIVVSHLATPFPPVIPWAILIALTAAMIAAAIAGGLITRPSRRNAPDR